MQPPDEFTHAGIPMGPGHMIPIGHHMNGDHNLNIAMASLQALADVGNAYAGILPVSSATPLDRSSIRKSPAEEELDDTEEGTEWAIRIGNAPPPSWSTKRKADDDGNHNTDKRSRLQE